MHSVWDCKGSSNHLCSSLKLAILYNSLVLSKLEFMEELRTFDKLKLFQVDYRLLKMLSGKPFPTRKGIITAKLSVNGCLTDHKMCCIGHRCYLWNYVKFVNLFSIHNASSFYKIIQNNCQFSTTEKRWKVFIMLRSHIIIYYTSRFLRPAA